MTTRRTFLQGGLASLAALGATSLVAQAGCAPRGAVALTVRGSDSELNLVQRLAEVFMASRADVSIGVTGGGSGVGIAALLDGTPSPSRSATTSPTARASRECRRGSSRASSRGRCGAPPCGTR